LRFDVKRNSASKNKNGSNVYFWVTFVGYILGLVTTVVVMHTFQAAQPALLYLVPACIGCSFATAVYRGEIPVLLAYSEEVPPEKKE
jgi:minor histocompatibility antigen H13